MYSILDVVKVFFLKDTINRPSKVLQPIVTKRHFMFYFKKKRAHCSMHLMTLMKFSDYPINCKQFGLHF